MLILPVIIIVVLYFLIRKGYLQNITSSFSKSDKTMTIDDKYNSIKVEEEKELNKLLDKINKKDYESLSANEKNRLTELSQK